MSITYSEFRAGLRLVLTDPAQWRDSQLLQWTHEALEELSANIPFRDVSAISTNAGVRQYLLNGLTSERLVDVLGVEYPADQSPRRFLLRREERHPAFLGGPYYDVNKQNLTVGFEHSELFFLVLGETPAQGEIIWFEYSRAYTPPANDSDLITVPTSRVGLLRQYVLWKAAQSLEMDESISLQRQTEMLKALGGSAERLHTLYRERLMRMVQGTPGSLALQWRMDGPDRVY